MTSKHQIGLVVSCFLAGCVHAESTPVLDEYLSVFNEKTTANLPLSDDASFYGPLLSEPIVGNDEVAQFLDRVLPSLELVRVKQALEGDGGACAELVFGFGDRELEEVHCIEFQQGAITSLRLYFDPRPLLTN